jgi:hypothetical protein
MASLRRMPVVEISFAATSKQTLSVEHVYPFSNSAILIIKKRTDVDIRMCAGFPSRTVDIESGQIWTYERAINRGGLNVALPTVGVGALPGLGASLNVAPGGYCNAQVRFTNGRVVDIVFAGDNDLPQRRNALCTTVVYECVAYARTPHPAVKGR